MYRNEGEFRKQRNMVEITEASCLANWLEGRPPEFACAVAARIAMRMAPLLNDALRTDETSRRKRVVLPIFRALAAINFAGGRPDQFGGMQQAIWRAVRLASDELAAHFNECQMNVIHCKEAVPEEIFYIQEMESDRDAASVAFRAVKVIECAARSATEMNDFHTGSATIEAVVESVIEAANEADWAVDGANGYEEARSVVYSDDTEDKKPQPHIRSFWRAVEWDVIHLVERVAESDGSTMSLSGLSEAPLWAEGIPTWASRRWSTLKENLPAEEGWEVWTNWYEARLVGRRINPALEIAKLSIADSVWGQGPERANAAIASLQNLHGERWNCGNFKLPKDCDYHVALSFAGEQRNYVAEVAHHLEAKGVAVFYDEFLEAELWGRDGAEEFHSAYADRAKYVVMFISEAYASKVWTRHEQRSAISRMLKEKREYVLPVRFDMTPIQGLPDTILYLRAEENSPEELAAKIARKLGFAELDGTASDVPPPRMMSQIE